MLGARCIGVLASVSLLLAACGDDADDAFDTAEPHSTLGQVSQADAGGPVAQPPMSEAADPTDLEVSHPPPDDADGDGVPPQDVTFADHGVAGFVRTEDLALSTFQTDADAASFRLTEAWLERRGVLPPAEAIRAEEWINALDHRYPDPEPAELFHVAADVGAPWWHAPPGSPQDTVLLRIGVQATREVTRAPASITLVIDTSGSMSTDDRLGTVVEVVSDLLDRLDERDQVAIVEFDDQARVVIERTNDYGAVQEALHGLTPSGSTNTGAGVVLGHDLARGAARPGDNSVVVLFADGVANRGITDPDGILEQLGDGERIVMHTVGVGLEVYNDALLERLANASSGTYAYVDLPEHAEQLFDRDLPVLEPIAHDVKAQIEFDPDVVGSWRLIGYENRLIDAEDFRDDAVPGGYVGAGHAVTALYELVLDTESGDPTGQLGTVAVRWATPDSGDVDERTTDLPAGLMDVSASPTFGTAAAVAAVAELLRGSPYVVVSLEEVAAQLEATGDDQDRRLAELVRAAASSTQVGSPDRTPIGPPGANAPNDPPAP